MANIEKWEQVIKEMPSPELIKKRSALVELLEWGFFKSEYNEFGLSLILTIATNELKTRRYNY